MVEQVVGKDMEGDMASTGPGDVFDLKKLRRLIELMHDHELAELDLQQGDHKIRLRRAENSLAAAPAPSR